MSGRIPDNVWGVVLPADAPALPPEGGPSPVEGREHLPQRVACYACHIVTRTVVYVSGTSYCLDHAPRPATTPQEPQ